MDFIEKEILALKDKNATDISRQLLLKVLSELEGLNKGLNKDYYTIPEVANKFKTNEATVRKWIKENKLKAFQNGKIIRIKPASLVEFDLQFTV